MAWKFIHNILKDSHLKSFIKKYSKQTNRAYKAWKAITNHFTDQNPEQLQLILQNKLENVAVQNSGDIKFDFLQCVNTFDLLFQELEDNPQPFNVTHSTYSKKIFLQSALAKSPRYVDILKLCTEKATGYVKYQKALLKVIDNQVLLEKLRNSNPTSTTNQLIQAQNETSTVKSLVTQLTDGDNIDYDTIAEKEGPDKLRVLHSALRNNLNRINRASKRFNKYGRRDSPYNNNNDYNNDNNYNNNSRNNNNSNNNNNRYDNYDNSNNNSNSSQNDHNSDQPRNDNQNDHNSDRRYNDNNNNYNNRYDNNRYDNYNNRNRNNNYNNNYRGRGGGGRGYGRGRGFYTDQEQFNYDNNYNNYQRRDNYNNYGGNYNGNYNNNNQSYGAPANNQQGAYPNNQQPPNLQQPQVQQYANLTHYGGPPMSIPYQPYTINTALPVMPPIPPTFNNTMNRNPFARY